MRLSVKIALGGLLSLLTLMSHAQDVTPISEPPTSTATASVTATLIPILVQTATLEPTITEMGTETPFPERSTESPSPTLDVTVESSPVETTPEVTSELQTASFTATATEEPVIETIEVTDTSAVVTVTASISPIFTLIPSPTETASISMEVVAGRAFYQNHGSDNSGIQVSVFDPDGILIGITQTDTKGQFTLEVPIQSHYQLVVEASLHRQILFTLSDSEHISEIVLAGGDLDADGCIGQSDLDLFMKLFSSFRIAEGDITGDGKIDSSDFAILAGNYENNCPSMEPTPTDNPLPVSPVPSPTLVTSVTLEILLETPTEEATVAEGT